MSRIERHHLLGNIPNSRPTNNKNRVSEILKRKPDALSLSKTAQTSTSQMSQGPAKAPEAKNVTPKHLGVLPKHIGQARPEPPATPTVAPQQTNVTEAPAQDTKTPAKPVATENTTQPTVTELPDNPVATEQQAPVSENTATSSTSNEISAEGRNQMDQLLQAAIEGSGGKRPKGRCYEMVWNYICQAGYGKMPAVDVPSDYSAYARNFAEYANEGDNAAQLGLRRLDIDNPYEAPPGSLVVVRPGTPGTAHPVAGDIAIVGQDGALYNDGEMSYGGSENFPPGNDYVLGIYTPV